MEHTYRMTALNLAQYADNEPSPNRPPILSDEDDLDSYMKNGWVVIGHASLTVDYLSKEEVHSQQLGALKQQLQSVRAENQKRENAILDQISKLQALTFVEAA